jgi:GntR family negative regulator for fad regulon and positive regulator of fabA
MMNPSWPTPPPKPAEYTETQIIGAILDGRFQIGATLPGERQLAQQLGVTRPTLREALQRLARDGWVEICQGKPTRIRNYWQEGNLGLLSALVQQSEHLPENFVAHLLAVRLAIAPAYTRLSIQNQPREIAVLLERLVELDDEPSAFAQSDWELHRALTIASQNPIFTLILNGFNNFYQAMAIQYFASSQARQASRIFYQELLAAAGAQDAGAAENITRQMMQNSLSLWEEAKTVRSRR